MNEKKHSYRIGVRSRRKIIRLSRKEVSEAVKIYLSKGGLITSLDKDLRAYQDRPGFHDDMFNNNINF